VTDLIDRMRNLDRIQAPDLLPEIEKREPAAKPMRGSRRRWPTVLLALVITVSALAVVGRAFLAPSTQDSEEPASNAPRQVSGLAEGVALECTVTLLTPSVELGDQVRAIFGYRNTGDTAYLLPIDGGSPRLLVYDGAGTLLYDTDLGSYWVEGIDSGSDLEEVLPGETLERQSEFQAIWNGPLTLEPLCGYGIPGDTKLWSDGEVGVIDLPPLTLDVSVRGQRPPAEDALARALGATYGLFEQCTPGADGSPVDGVIEAPARWRGRVLPALEARCRAVLQERTGFVSVDLLFVSPPDLAFPTELTDSNRNRGLVLPPNRPGAQMGRWTFLVTEDRVIDTPGAARGFVREQDIGLGVVVQLPDRCRYPACWPVSFRHKGARWVARRIPFPGAEVVPGIYFFR
jgi:hypothetical protein